PEETIQDFIEQFPHDSVTAGHATSDQVEDHQAVESERRMATTFLRLILISIPIAGVVMYIGANGDRFLHRTQEAEPIAQAAPPARAARAPQRDPPPPPPTPAVAPPPAPAAAEPAAPSTPPPPTPVSADDRLTVGLTIRRPCWVTATVDGEKKIERLLQPGE